MAQLCLRRVRIHFCEFNDGKKWPACPCMVQKGCPYSLNESWVSFWEYHLPFTLKASGTQAMADFLHGGICKCKDWKLHQRGKGHNNNLLHLHLRSESSHVSRYVLSVEAWSFIWMADIIHISDQDQTAAV